MLTKWMARVLPANFMKTGTGTDLKDEAREVASQLKAAAIEANVTRLKTEMAEILLEPGSVTLDAAQPPEQAGFRSGYGCADHLFAVV